MERYQLKKAKWSLQLFGCSQEMTLQHRYVYDTNWTWIDNNTFEGRIIDCNWPYGLSQEISYGEISCKFAAYFLVWQFVLGKLPKAYFLGLIRARPGQTCSLFLGMTACNLFLGMTACGLFLGMTACSLFLGMTACNLFRGMTVGQFLPGGARHLRGEPWQQISQALGVHFRARPKLIKSEFRAPAHLATYFLGWQLAAYFFGFPNNLLRIP